MKYIKTIAFAIMMFFVVGSVYAAQPTYESKKIAGGGNQCGITFYNADGEKVNYIEIKKDIFDATGLPTSGNLTVDTMKKIRNASINYCIEQCDSCLNTEVTVLRGAGNTTMPQTNKLSKYIPNEKPNETSKRSVILAYNLNIIKNKLKEASNKNEWEKLKFNIVSLPETKTSDNSNYKTYGTDFPAYPNSDGKKVEEKYESLLTLCNIYFVNDDSRLAKMKTALVETGLIATESNNSNSQQQSSVDRDVGSTGSGDWWKDAQSFFGSAKNSGQDAGAADSLVTELSDMIFDVGNMIFIVVTSILGVKYIFGSAEGKAQIKDSLITLIVAALFFYGWSAISSLLDIGGLLASGTFESTAAKIYNTVLFIVNLAAIAGVIWIGVKYMLSSAEGKAEIKTSWGPLILGIIMVYATVWFLSTIISAILG